MENSLISNRGIENIKNLDIPWRFAPGKENLYNEKTRPNRLISFGTAENSYITKYIEDFLKKNNFQISSTFFNYGTTDGGPIFRNLMSSHINTHFNPVIPISPENLIVANGITAISSMFAFSIGDIGDAILVSTPIYGRFELDYGNIARVKVLYAKMKDTNPFESAVVDRYEEALKNATSAGIRVRAILISNPSNPLGHCYPRETLIKLMAFCQRYKIHLISDEVYALSVFSPPTSTSAPFTSLLSIDSSHLIDRNLLHVLYGMSKDFGLAGLKIGCAITWNKDIIRSCGSIQRFHAVSGPTVQVSNEILGNPEFVQNLLDFSHGKLREGYKVTTTTLDDAGIPYHRGSNAGFFVYIDLSRYLSHFESKTEDKDPEFCLAQHIHDHGVFLHPKEEHNEKPGHFRLTYASVDLPVLKLGLQRLTMALKKIEPI